MEAFARADLLRCRGRLAQALETTVSYTTNFNKAASNTHTHTHKQKTNGKGVGKIQSEESSNAAAGCRRFVRQHGAQSVAVCSMQAGAVCFVCNTRHSAARPRHSAGLKQTESPQDWPTIANVCRISRSIKSHSLRTHRATQSSLLSTRPCSTLQLANSLLNLEGSRAQLRTRSLSLCPSVQRFQCKSHFRVQASKLLYLIQREFHRV